MQSALEEAHTHTAVPFAALSPTACMRVYTLLTVCTCACVHWVRALQVQLAVTESRVQDQIDAEVLRAVTAATAPDAVGPAPIPPGAPPSLRGGRGGGGGGGGGVAGRAMSFLRSASIRSAWSSAAGAPPANSTASSPRERGRPSSSVLPPPPPRNNGWSFRAMLSARRSSNSHVGRASFSGSMSDSRNSSVRREHSLEEERDSLAPGPASSSANHHPLRELSLESCSCRSEDSSVASEFGGGAGVGIGGGDGGGGWVGRRRQPSQLASAIGARRATACASCAWEQSPARTAGPLGRAPAAGAADTAGPSAAGPSAAGAPHPERPTGCSSYDAQVPLLCDMGFGEAQVRAALASTAGDVEAAIAALASENASNRPSLGPSPLASPASSLADVWSDAAAAEGAVSAAESAAPGTSTRTRKSSIRSERV